jgi:sodium transport system permease protein
MMKKLLVVFKKELKDLLRDRRTIIAMLASSVVAGPLMLWGITKWVDSLESKVAARVVQIVNIERAPSLENFLKRRDVKIEKPTGDVEARVRDGSLPAVLIINEGFEDALRKGEPAEVELLFDSTRASSGTLSRSYSGFIREFNSEVGSGRLLTRGVSPMVLQGTKIINRDIADERQRGAFILFGLQISLLLMPLIASLSSATDVTAGERERSSLEPLVMNPISPMGLVAGKWLAVFTLACLMVVLAMGAYFVTLKFLPAAVAFLRFGVPEMAQFALILLPVAALFAAACMVLGLIAKSFKEAQTYQGYLMMVASFVPTIAFILEWQDKPWQMFLPIVGQNAAMTKVLGGKAMSVMDFGVPAIVAIVLTGVCLAILARSIQKERIVFGR